MRCIVRRDVFLLMLRFDDILYGAGVIYWGWRSERSLVWTGLEMDWNIFNGTPHCRWSYGMIWIALSVLHVSVDYLFALLCFVVCFAVYCCRTFVFVVLLLFALLALFRFALL
jgi:hypothetical protein